MKPATTKDFEAKQLTRISRMRALLMVYYRFYGTLLTALPDAVRADIETAATDGRKIYWNLQFVATLSDKQLVFVLAHEVLHCSLMHHLRRMGRDSLLWNIAGDYVINAILIREKIGEMPEGCLHDPKFDGWAVEAVYEALRQEQEQEKQQQQQQQGGADADDRGNQGNDPTEGTQDSDQQGDGEGDAGSSESAQDGRDGAPEGGEAQDGQGGSARGSEPQEGKAKETNGSGGSEGTQDGQEPSRPKHGGEVDPGRCGGVIDAPGDAVEQAEQAAEWQRHVREAVSQQMRSSQAGDANATSQAVLDAIDDRQVNWEQELAEFVSESASKDYSWAKRDIRFAATPFIVPGEVSDGVPHLLWVHDVSASMSDEVCTKCAAIAQDMLNTGLVDRVTVIKVDTDVRSADEYVAGDIIDLTAPRGGGTKFQPAWDYLAQMDEEPVAVIYATDLDAYDGFGEEPSVPVLWLAATSSEYDRPRLRERMAAVPFGRCLEVR